MIEEFKKFILRGNVIDMAVGIIIGASFSTIVKSLVDDVLMPPLGFLTSGIDFADIFLTLKEGKIPGPYVSVDAAQKAGAITINIGHFINALIAFLIVSFAVFLLVKMVGKLYKKEEAAASAPPKQEVLLEEIRDLLKK